MSTETAITPPSQVAAPPEPRRMAHGTRHRVQSRVFRIGRWVVIIGFLIATLVPFYYTLLLSVKPIIAVERSIPLMLGSARRRRVRLVRVLSCCAVVMGSPPRRARR